MTEKVNLEQGQLREHVLYLLRGGGAHLSFADFVKDFPPELSGQRVENLPYTPWQVLEHMRIAQWDILEFSRNAKHTSPDFPRGYWPAPEELGSKSKWEKTVAEFRADRKEMEDLISDPGVDVFAKIPYGTGQTLLREALLVADHNAYHLGVLAVMARLLKQ